MKLSLISLLLCLSLLITATSQATEIAGVNIDDTVQVAATTLKLNGAGIRTKLFFKIYVAALYLNEPQTTVKGILAVPGPKEVTLTMLRDLSSNSFADAFMSGVKKNTDIAERAQLTPQFLSLGQLFATVQGLKKGDVVAIEWLPTMGTTIFINGKKIGETFSDVAFFNAILRIWLGDMPVERSLKTQLMGGAS